MIELPADARGRFDRDGFVIADRIIEDDTIPRLHNAFDDLFDGRFETGVRRRSRNLSNRTDVDKGAGSHLIGQRGCSQSGRKL